MVETRRLRELRDRAHGQLLLPDGDLVVALSGGADSAALAYLVATLGRPFRAVHVDHRLAASRRLEAAAREVASAVGADLEVIGVDVPPGASVEGQARVARYRALLGSLRPNETLLTAHTRDDQAETVLMNLLRGTGPSGLAGIPYRNGPVVRPTLSLTRSETRELSGLAGLPFHDDPMNLDPGLRRNAIRLQVIPELSARFNPRLVDALARTASLLSAEEEFFADQSAGVPASGDSDLLFVPLGALLAVPRPVADRTLRDHLARIRPPHGPTARELADVWEVVSRERASVTLAGGVEVIHAGPSLVFRTRRPESRAPEPMELSVGTHRLGRFELSVERVDAVCHVAPLGLWSALFPPDSELMANTNGSGRLVVTVAGETAWIPGEKRFPVAWYAPGTRGYLSVFAKEESGWTSSP